MAIFEKELQERVDRLVNGLWLSVMMGRSKVCFRWSKGIDPVSAGGMKTNDYRRRMNAMGYLEPWCDDPFTLQVLDNGKSFDLFFHSTALIGEVLPGETREFPNLYQAVCFVLDNMSQAGTLSLNQDKEQNGIDTYLNCWGLGKETYTRDEVKEIIGMIKSELVKSTESHLDRMLGRIDQDVRK